MKQIQRRLGDSGFAAAIRLIEVMTYRSGTGTKFNPILTLAPPQSKLWLAREVLSWDDDDTTDDDLVAELTRYINEFQLAGLIVCQHADGRKPVHSAEGGWSEQPCKWLTIQLVEFEEFMDVWTARKVKDAQRHAE